MRRSARLRSVMLRTTKMVPWNCGSSVAIGEPVIDTGMVWPLARLDDGLARVGARRAACRIRRARVRRGCEMMPRPTSSSSPQASSLQADVVGHADDAVGRGHEHRVGHAAEHVGQVVLVDGGLAQLLPHALERRLQFAEFVAPPDFQRPRIVAVGDAIRALDQRVDGLMHAPARPPGEDEPDQQRHGAEHACDDQRLANLAAFDGIEARACRGCVWRRFQRADFDLDFAHGLRSFDAGQGLHVGANRRDRAAGDGARQRRRRVATHTARRRTDRAPARRAACRRS